MDDCKDVHEHNVNIGCQTVNDEKEHVLSEEESGNVVCDKATAAAAAAVHHLEQDDEDSFEDAVNNLTLVSSGIADIHISGCNDLALEHKTDTLQPLCSNLQDVTDEMLTGADDRAATVCEDSKVANEKQQLADDNRVIIDEEILRQKEACLTDEQKQSRKEEAVRLKELGNKHFNSGRFEAAVVSYTDALATCLLCHSVDRAIMYSNRAAAKMKLQQYEDAIADCTKALEFNPDYMKALLRRAELYEKTDKLDEALEEYTKALERDCSLHVARAACMRLPDQIKERNEKMKEEMIGKLKDLGNMILRPFGLSTNNFRLQQDPNTGSYSVSFQQNAEPPS